MSELSPAAQAIAWAYDNVPEKETGNHRYHWLAAALHAVVDQCKIEWEYHPDYPETLSVIIASDLLAIATDFRAMCAELVATLAERIDDKGNEVLSPAAQAVLDAFVSNAGEGHRHQSGAAASALRAAADQVVPASLFGPPENAAAAQREITRAAILAIAAELEGHVIS